MLKIHPFVASALWFCNCFSLCCQAANYMDIKSLLHLGCSKVASLIKGQPLESIKAILAKGTKNEQSTTATKQEQKN